MCRAIILSSFRIKTKIIYDSGLRSGLDVLKTLSLGADFVFMGRAFIYGGASLDGIGVKHVIELLKDDLINNMIQCGVSSLEELKEITLFNQTIQL